MLDTRPRLFDVSLERHRGDVVCKVRLGIGEVQYEGVAVGASRHEKARLGTEATATALAGMPDLPIVRIEEVDWLAVVDAKVLQVTCSIGGKVRAMPLMKLAVLVRPFEPPFSQTTILSKLILEMA